MNSYSAVKEKIKKAAQGKRVELVAVSKKQTMDAIQGLYALGQRDFGENYAQELIKKSEEADALGMVEIRWHYIGGLQKNKIKALLPIVYCIQSVDSKNLLEDLEKKSGELKLGRRLPVFIQVNMSEEMQKGGVAVKELRELLECAKVCQNVEVKGLMCIPRMGDLEAYSRLKELSLDVGSLTRGELSMGMSDDFETTIQAGATMVRIGTLLFGKRPAPSSN